MAFAGMEEGDPGGGQGGEVGLADMDRGVAGRLPGERHAGAFERARAEHHRRNIERQDDDGDEQARWIEAEVMGARHAVTVAGLYLPNGNPAPGPKYDYKLAWMERLRARAAALLDTEAPVVMLGDYNVIPEPRDAPYVGPISIEVDATDIDRRIAELGDWRGAALQRLRGLIHAAEPAVVAVAGVANERPLVVVATNQAARDKGVKAGDLVRLAAKTLGGGGGGKPDLAQGGGQDATAVPAALHAVAGELGA